jgi:putative aldouronate transport system permease protein
MITYAPYFISTVVMVGMIMQFLSPKIGFVNRGLGFLGIEPILFMGEAGLFSSVYVWTNVWQHTGWNSIIYLAALSTVDPNLHEAAIVDGANRFKRVLHIDIPRILPTIIVLLIIRSGQIMNVGFEKVFLMQNPLNMARSEIITTYVYKVGLVSSIPQLLLRCGHRAVQLSHQPVADSLGEQVVENDNEPESLVGWLGPWPRSRCGQPRAIRHSI